MLRAELVQKDLELVNASSKHEEFVQIIVLLHVLIISQGFPPTARTGKKRGANRSSC